MSVNVRKCPYRRLSAEVYTRTIVRVNRARPVGGKASVHRKQADRAQRRPALTLFPKTEKPLVQPRRTCAIRNFAPDGLAARIRRVSKWPKCPQRLARYDSTERAT
jgi:hypothetical protein